MASPAELHTTSAHPLPSITPPSQTLPSPTPHPDSRASSTNSSSDSEQAREGRTILQRPNLSARQSSGTNIIPRDHPHVELEDEHFGPDDARAMSPRRTSEDVERLSQETRRSLQAYVAPLPFPSPLAPNPNEKRVSGEVRDGMGWTWTWTWTWSEHGHGVKS